MKHIKIILFLSGALIILSGCTTDTALLKTKTGDRAEIRMRTSISGTNYVSTKVFYEEDHFIKDQTIGVMVLEHDNDQYVAHQNGYDNINAICSNDEGSSWKYQLPTLKDTVQNMFLTTREDGVHADIYAYSPYNSNAKKPTEIPYSHITYANTDLLYAIENASSISNKDLYPSAGESIAVSFNFRHVLACIRVGIKKKIAGDEDHMLDNIRIRTKDKNIIPLYYRTILNSLTGEFDHSKATLADSLTRDNNMWSAGENKGLFNSTDYTYWNILICPTEVVNDNVLELVLKVDSKDYVYKIQMKDVRHRDSGGSPTDDYGFKAGYVYTYHFILDNYLHLTDITIKTDWEEGGTINKQI